MSLVPLAILLYITRQQRFGLYRYKREQRRPDENNAVYIMTQLQQLEL
jgi:hypothetical protein